MLPINFVFIGASSCSGSCVDKKFKRKNINIFRDDYFKARIIGDNKFVIKTVEKIGHITFTTIRHKLFEKK